MSQSVIWQVPNLAQGIVDNSAGTLTFQTYDTATSSYVTQWTMDLSTGVITEAAPVQNNSATKDVTGASAGSFTWVMPDQGSAKKTVLVYFDGYENDTAIAQTVTYPTAFTVTPGIDNLTGMSGLGTDTTQLVINPNATAKYTGWVKVWGF